MSDELGRGRPTMKSMTKKSVHITIVPSQIKMPVTNQGVAHLPLSLAITAISESRMNLRVIELTEGMGSFSVVGQPREVPNHDPRGSCCKSLVVCRSIAHGAG